MKYKQDFFSFVLLCKVWVSLHLSLMRMTVGFTFTCSYFHCPPPFLSLYIICSLNCWCSLLVMSCFSMYFYNFIFSPTISFYSLTIYIFFSIMVKGILTSLGSELISPLNLDGNWFLNVQCYEASTENPLIISLEAGKAISLLLKWLHIHIPLGCNILEFLLLYFFFQT